MELDKKDKNYIFYDESSYRVCFYHDVESSRRVSGHTAPIRIYGEEIDDSDWKNVCNKKLPKYYFEPAPETSHVLQLSKAFIKLRNNFYTNELKKRYDYVSENYLFWLAPFIQKSNIQVIKNGKARTELCFYCKPSISFLFLLEDFLFNIKEMEKSPLYIHTESLKNDSKYLNKVNIGIDLIKESQNDKLVSVFDLLKIVRHFIEGQVNHPDIADKCVALNKYFNISRYTNDGKRWYGGYYLASYDRKMNINGKEDNIGNNDMYVFNIPSNGIRVNDFISFLCCNSEVLSEEEKQELFLKHHKISTFCNKEEMDSSYQNDNRLVRPDNTEPCFNSFYVEEENVISVLNKGFYTLCPFCGYIVKVDDKVMPDSMKNRIIDRTNEDEFALKKIFLYSELKALDGKSLPHQKILNRVYSSSLKKSSN